MKTVLMFTLLAVGAGAQTAKPVWPKIAGHAQGILTPEQQAADPANAWMKPCAPDNHDDWCVQPKPIEKQETENLWECKTTDCMTWEGNSAIAALSSPGLLRVYDNALIAQCDMTGEFQHGVVSNCVISEGHTLTEVMQAWLKNEDANDAARKGR